MNKLQVSLKDFRKLCILKGIYPREPKKKFKGTNTTYFFAKDVQFLMHEPLLAKFREQKAFLKKIAKATGRHEKLKAKRLEERKPVYKLDHLIRERYPTFVDALQELDDALCLVFLFASLSPSKYVPAARVNECARLRREFLAYVARTRALRYVFISIKGIYYQAEVNGVTLTWIEPHHSFAQQPTMSVDYRVMSSFLELYEAVLTFVGFKLYHDLGLSYPPKIDAKADGAGVHLGAAILAPKPTAATAAAPPLALTNKTPAAAPSSAALTSTQLASLRSKLRGMDQAGRETPIPSLEFIILALGGKVGWEGEASPFSIDDARITHHVIDRPFAGEGDGKQRERVQPQWLYDSINARELLPTYAYRPGVKCPPHLSPFADAGKGEEPKERVRLAVLEATQAADKGDDAEAEEAEDDEGDEEDEEGDEEEGEEEEDDDEEDEEEDEEAALYRKELAAEVAGVSYAETTAAKSAAAAKRKHAGASGAGGGGEEKELAMMMMSRKKRRLYDRMQYGINRKADAEAKLQAKRDAIDAAAKAKKKGGGKKA